MEERITRGCCSLLQLLAPSKGLWACCLHSCPSRSSCWLRWDRPFASSWPEQSHPAASSMPQSLMEALRIHWSWLPNLRCSLLAPRWSLWFVSGRGRCLGFPKESWDLSEMLVLMVELESNDPSVLHTSGVTDPHELEAAGSSRGSGFKRNTGENLPAVFHQTSFILQKNRRANFRFSSATARKSSFPGCTHSPASWDVAFSWETFPAVSSPTS